MSSRTKIKPEPDSNFNELLRDGLSSAKSYVVLKQKNRSPIYLAFKPFVYRLHPYAFYLGGKLSAFPDFTNEEMMQGNADERQKLLAKSFNIASDRSHDRRVGSNAGIYIAAGTGDSEATIDKVVTKTVVKTILDGIEEKVGVEIENKIDVSKYLIQKYNEFIPTAFGYGSTAKIPHRIVGKKSELIFGMAAVTGGQAFHDFLSKHGLDKLEIDLADNAVDLEESED
jgi:hypothetical protein